MRNVFLFAMQYHDTRIIGSQGEMLACVLLQTDEIFRIQLLGGTVEAFDIYVEINDNLKSADNFSMV